MKSKIEERADAVRKAARSAAQKKVAGISDHSVEAEKIDLPAIQKRMKELCRFRAFEQRGDYMLETPWIDLEKVLGGPDGIAYGKVIELHGMESGGKSVIAEILMGMAQADGAAATKVDSENSEDEQWARKMGVDWDNLNLIRPKLVKALSKTQLENLKDAPAEEKKKAKAAAPPRVQSAEELFDEAEASVIALAEAGFKKQVVIFDSIANLTTLKQIEAGPTGQTMNTKIDLPALLSSVLPRWATLASQYNLMVVVVNQMRITPGKYGDPFNTPAGWALKFACGNRSRIRRLKSGQLKNKGHVVGLVGIIKNVKNKMGRGSVEGESCGFCIRWDRPKAQIKFMTAAEAEAVLKGEG